MIRLIDTASLAFQEFENPNVPRYAIVSHRWGEDEVSYQDFLEGRKRESHGWVKIVKACEIARAHDLSWLWIDTCCIDKKSSAELTESINSMYRWYYHSHDCLALLSDVKSTDRDAGFSEHFRQSNWFTRGWTLQELLAPRRVLFFNADFEQIGDKYTRLQDIVEATGIDKYYLLGMSKIHYASIAERMQWASFRESTRVEDMAYCLLGLFDVNMPLLYGEGAKAFLRLQLEIIRKNDDESIFAWWQSAEAGSWHGLLAPSPQAFAYPKGEKIKILKSQSRRPYSMTHKGLELNISVPKSLEVPLRSSVTVLLPLNCERVFTTPENKLKRQQVALRINVKATGQLDIPIYEGTQFRARQRDDKLVLASDGQFFDRPNAYGCLYTIGMPSEDSPMQPLTIYFKQDGV